MPGTRIEESRPCTRLSFEGLRLLSAYVLQLPHHLHHLLT